MEKCKCNKPINECKCQGQCNEDCNCVKEQEVTSPEDLFNGE